MIHYNLKVTKIYTYNFNQNQILMKKNIVYDLHALVQ